MKHLARRAGLLLGLAAALVTASCDETYRGGDGTTDLTVELPGDAGAEGTGDSTSSCTYPEGPYAFGSGATVPPMAWSSAPGGLTETIEADLAQIRCDPSVNSIFILVTNTT